MPPVQEQALDVPTAHAQRGQNNEKARPPQAGAEGEPNKWLLCRRWGPGEPLRQCPDAGHDTQDLAHPPPICLRAWHCDAPHVPSPRSESSVAFLSAHSAQTPRKLSASPRFLGRCPAAAGLPSPLRRHSYTAPIAKGRRRSPPPRGQPELPVELRGRQLDADAIQADALLQYPKMMLWGPMPSPSRRPLSRRPSRSKSPRGRSRARLGVDNPPHVGSIRPPPRRKAKRAGTSDNTSRISAPNGCNATGFKSRHGRKRGRNAKHGSPSALRTWRAPPPLQGGSSCGTAVTMRPTPKGPLE